jgi:CTP synthase
VIPALDVPHIYDVPLAYHEEGLDDEVLAAFGIEGAPAPDLSRWQEISRPVKNTDGTVRIAVVGKYTDLKDAYKSLIEALTHGGIANKVKVKIDWIEAEVFENEDPSPYLEGVHGILVPGGFGKRGAEGKIAAAGFARTRKVPYFGICYGMQMAVLDAARNLAGIDHARSSEFENTEGPVVVGLMTEWLKGNALEKRAAEGRSGRHDAAGRIRGSARQGTKIACIYGDTDIFERHRHRYEVNIDYRDRWKRPDLSCRASHPMACCRKRSNMPITPGSSACSTTRS